MTRSSDFSRDKRILTSDDFSVKLLIFSVKCQSFSVVNVSILNTLHRQMEHDGQLRSSLQLMGSPGRCEDRGRGSGTAQAAEKKPPMNEPQGQWALCSWT